MLPRLRQAIRSVNPDILFLQEVIGENELIELRHSETPGVSQYEFLAEEFWPFHTYGKNAIYLGGHHGNAILSRYPIVSTTNTNISTNKLEQRGLLYCHVRMPQTHTVVHCLSAHLDLFRRGRRKQFLMIEEFIHKNIPSGSPLVLAGDFNDWANKDALNFSARMMLTDAVRVPSGKAVYTFPAKFPLLPLDHIFVRDTRVIHSVRYKGDNWEKLSDHIPLSASIEIE